MKLPIPEAALQYHLALLGKTGSGKSNAAKVLVEHLLDAKQRVCVIDPTGTWWGMRLSRDGKSASKYQIKILGGDQADLKIEHTHGSMVAEAVGTSHSAVIINTRQMTVGNRTRFFTDFAETLVRTNKGPLHLIIDEAHLFAPKGRVNDPQAGKMLSATNDMITLGRGLGLRIILISQRPQKVHNDALGSVETMVAMRLILPHDVSAIKDWIKEWADLKQGNDVVSSLPSLKTGDCWVWSPELGVLNRDHFPIARTYDSGSIKEGKAPLLKPIDLGDLEGRLAKVVEERKAADPKLLQAENAKLRSQIDRLHKAPNASSNGPALGAAEASGYAKGFAAGNAIYATFISAVQKVGAHAAQVVSSIENAQSQLAERQRAANGKLPQSGSQADIASPWTPPTRTTAVDRTAPAVRKPSPGGGGDGASIPKGEQAVLIAVSSFHNGMTRAKISVYTGYKKSTRDAYILRLREKGYVTERDGRIYGSDAGIDALGSNHEPILYGVEFRDNILSRLPAGEKTVLDILISDYPKSVGRETITNDTGYKKSTRDAYILRLKIRELVVVESDGVRASSDLFE